MRLPKVLSSISRKLLLLITAILIVIVIAFFIWERNKYKIVNDTIATTIAKKTDSLYKITYDSLHFDEVTGQAYLKNIHIGPDTSIIKNSNLEDLPYLLLDIKIASLRITGVKTDKALLGRQMIGDSVVIDHPDVMVYFVKPLQKHTKIANEAHLVYEEILGNLNRIQVDRVFINNINIKGIGFFTKEKDFDLINSNIQLFDVLIDSAHNFDTTRTLFCKQAALQVASFISYNNNRPEVRVNKMVFSGTDKLLSFNDISLNRFESENGDSSKLLSATNLSVRGLNTNEMINNKNIIIDSITCDHIMLYKPPVAKLKTVKTATPKQPDSTGFWHAYSIDMRHLGFPKVDFIPGKGSGYTVGNIAIKINEVKADEIIKVQQNPLDYSKEAEISCDKVSINTKDGLYNYSFQNIALNSLQKQLKIGSVAIKPFLSETAFSNKARVQKDRYDVVLSDIGLKSIDMKNLLDKKIIASDLTVNKAAVKIYSDLQKPSSGKNKLGNSPARLLKKIGVPINISRALLLNTLIEYREHEVLTDSTGDVKFTESTVHVTNISNIPEVIAKNNTMKISFESKALKTIPIKGNFTFAMDADDGKFTADGHISSFDARVLNEVAVPMAFMRLNSGEINSLDFNFTGNDLGAGGKMVMKYTDFKVDVLKGDKKSSGVKKKGLVSLLANIIVKNNNPNNGDLREVNPHADRNVQKSFFNLVWKVIFAGMKKTLGIP